MNRQLFLQLLEHPDSVSEQESIALQKFTEDFPYCQTGQLLFVKYLHSQQSVHYPEQLKIAAAYAADRKVLYNLIHATPSLTLPQETSELVLTKSVEEKSSHLQPPPADKGVEQVEESVEQISAEIISGEIVAETDSSQADIIQKRLDEIAALRASPPDPLQRRGESAPIKNIEEEIPKSEVLPAKEAIATPSPPETILEKIPQEKKEENSKSGRHSFTEWLKTVKKEPEEKKEEHKSASSTDEIINRFIETEPRIVPSKAEFYNPIKMAKQSLEEHEDLVSETLAGIFAEQGNLPRAIEMYRKLMLSNPEKSSFFAARIEKLTQQLNEGK